MFWRRRRAAKIYALRTFSRRRRRLLKPRYFVAANRRGILIVDRDRNTEQLIRIPSSYSSVKFTPHYELSTLEARDGTIQHQRNGAEYAERVFCAIRTLSDVDTRLIGSFVFILDDADNHYIRASIRRTILNKGVSVCAIVNWRNALVQEALAATRFAGKPGDICCVFIVYDNVHLFFKMERLLCGWVVRGFKSRANDFSPPGIKKSTKSMKKFKVNSVIFYVVGKRFSKNYINDIEMKFVQTGYFKHVMSARLETTKTPGSKESCPADWDALRGGVAKAIELFDAKQALKKKVQPKLVPWTVPDQCYHKLRINLDNKIHIDPQLFMKPYPFEFKIAVTAKKVQQVTKVWVDYENANEDYQYKPFVRYPFNFKPSSKLTLVLRIDSNGIAKIFPQIVCKNVTRYLQNDFSMVKYEGKKPHERKVRYTRRSRFVLSKRPKFRPTKARLEREAAEEAGPSADWSQDDCSALIKQEPVSPESNTCSGFASQPSSSSQSREKVSEPCDSQMWTIKRNDTVFDPINDVYLIVTNNVATAYNPITKENTVIPYDEKTMGVKLCKNGDFVSKQRQYLELTTGMIMRDINAYKLFIKRYDVKYLLSSIKIASEAAAKKAAKKSELTTENSDDDDNVTDEEESIMDEVQSDDEPYDILKRSAESASTEDGEVKLKCDLKKAAKLKRIARKNARKVVAIERARRGVESLVRQRYKEELRILKKSGTYKHKHVVRKEVSYCAKQYSSDECESNFSHNSSDLSFEEKTFSTSEDDDDDSDNDNLNDGEDSDDAANPGNLNVEKPESPDQPEGNQKESDDGTKNVDKNVDYSSKVSKMDSTNAQTSQQKDGAVHLEESVDSTTQKTIELLKSSSSQSSSALIRGAAHTKAIVTVAIGASEESSVSKKSFEKPQYEDVEIAPELNSVEETMNLTDTPRKAKSRQKRAVEKEKSDADKAIKKLVETPSESRDKSKRKPSPTKGKLQKDAPEKLRRTSVTTTEKRKTRLQEAVEKAKMEMEYGKNVKTEVEDVGEEPTANSEELSTKSKSTPTETTRKTRTKSKEVLKKPKLEILEPEEEVEGNFVVVTPPQQSSPKKTPSKAVTSKKRTLTTTKPNESVKRSKTQKKSPSPKKVTRSSVRLSSPKQEPISPPVLRIRKK